jgi:hypothetical protein
MFGSMNDAHILRTSSLYQKVVYGDMFRLNQGEKKLSFTFLGTKVTLCCLG